MDKDKTIIVTGANCGIGFDTCIKLCQEGHNIILACRNEQKGEDALTKLRQQLPTARAKLMKLDVSVPSSIKEFVKDFLALGQDLDVLVNNAGVFFESSDTRRLTTPDGHETTMATNHLGPFLLTNLLLDKLKETANKKGEARIVNVTSTLHDKVSAQMMAKRSKVKDIADLDFDDFMLAKPEVYNAIQAYKNSKAALNMFTFELARRLEGSDVTVNCVCPGFIPATELSRHSGAGSRFFLKNIFPGMMKLFNPGVVSTLDEGSNRLVQLATGADVKGESGKFYSKGEVAIASTESQDVENCKKLWDISENLMPLA